MNPQSGGNGYQPLPKSNKAPVIIILLVVLLLAAVSFGAWAFSSRQDYKNNSDQKAAAAVTQAEAAQKTQLQAQFDQQLKTPYKTYTGSATFGTITFNYPLTYSAYVDTTSSSQPIEGYFHPSVVPGIQSDTAFALRVELVDTAYNQVVTQVTAAGQQSAPTAAAYIPPKMKDVKNVQPGTLFTGAIGQDSQGNAQNGEMLVIPVRDKTLQIYTESNDFLGDFNNIVLASLTFEP